MPARSDALTAHTQYGRAVRKRILSRHRRPRLPPPSAATSRPVTHRLSSEWQRRWLAVPRLTPNTFSGDDRKQSSSVGGGGGALH